jgi:hypothetical protein
MKKPAKELAAYLAFRAEQEGVSCELDAEWFLKQMEAAGFASASSVSNTTLEELPKISSDQTCWSGGVHAIGRLLRVRMLDRVNAPGGMPLETAQAQGAARCDSYRHVAGAMARWPPVGHDEPYAG